jgi:serine/threonine protein kinase
LKLRDPNPERAAGPISLYHPPEHAAGKFLPQGDQYALAVVLFEMITGQLPKSRQGAPPNEPPFISARSILPSIPEEMEWVLFRALSPDPQERYPHTSMFAEDLEQILRGKPVIAAPGFVSASHLIPPPDLHPREEIASESLPEVSPLESVLMQAARPRSNPPRKVWGWVALAIVLLGALAVWLYLYLW